LKGGFVTSMAMNTNSLLGPVITLIPDLPLSWRMSRRDSPMARSTSPFWSCSLRFAAEGTMTTRTVSIEGFGDPRNCGFARSTISAPARWETTLYAPPFVGFWLAHCFAHGSEAVACDFISFESKTYSEMIWMCDESALG
jgi:hypothetical protein